MKKTLSITALLLGALWLSAIIVSMLYLAGLVSTEWLIGAMGAFVAACALSLALLLVTNTRRPRGIDPDEAARSADGSLMDSIGALLDSAAARHQRGGRVPQELTHED